jgi:hypothetical protein
MLKDYEPAMGKRFLLSPVFSADDGAPNLPSVHERFIGVISSR